MIFLGILSGHLCETLDLRHRKCHYCCLRLLHESSFYPPFNHFRLTCHINGLFTDTQGRAQLWLHAMLFSWNPSVMGGGFSLSLFSLGKEGPCQLLCAPLAQCFSTHPSSPFPATQPDGFLSAYLRWPRRNVSLSTNKMQIMQVLQEPTCKAGSVCVYLSLCVTSSHQVMFQKDLCNKVMTGSQMCLEHLIHCFLNPSIPGRGREATIHLFFLYIQPSRLGCLLPAPSSARWHWGLFLSFCCLTHAKHNCHPLKEGRNFPWRNTIV